MWEEVGIIIEILSFILYIKYLSCYNDSGWTVKEVQRSIVVKALQDFKLLMGTLACSLNWEGYTSTSISINRTCLLACNEKKGVYSKNGVPNYSRWKTKTWAPPNIYFWTKIDF